MPRSDATNAPVPEEGRVADDAVGRVGPVHKCPLAVLSSAEAAVPDRCASGVDGGRGDQLGNAVGGKVDALAVVVDEVVVERADQHTAGQVAASTARPGGGVVGLTPRRR
jgi:hypothetical protein